MKRQLGSVRRAVAERFGVDWYSRPSLHGIEDRLDQLFEGARGGYFIEAGAFNGLAQSNTYWLERMRGWRGVLVEPVPQHFEACRARRRATAVQAALVDSAHDGSPVTIRHAGLMSIVHGAQGSIEGDDAQIAAGLAVQPGVETFEVQVPARTLTNVLVEVNAPSTIGLLSLDVEGFEPQVLDGLDVGRFAPRFVLVEMNRPDEVDRWMTANGYELVDGAFTMQDALYRRTT